MPEGSARRHQTTLVPSPSLQSFFGMGRDPGVVEGFCPMNSYASEWGPLCPACGLGTCRCQPHTSLDRRCRCGDVGLKWRRGGHRVSLSGGESRSERPKRPTAKADCVQSGSVSAHCAGRARRNTETPLPFPVRGDPARVAHRRRSQRCPAARSGSIPRCVPSPAPFVGRLDCRENVTQSGGSELEPTGLHTPMYYIAASPQ